jgi:hypothetical protein
MIKVVDNEIIIEYGNNTIHINEYNHHDVFLMHDMNVKNDSVASILAKGVFQKFSKYLVDDFMQKNNEDKSVDFNTIENMYSLTYQNVVIQINEKAKNEILLKSKKLGFIHIDSYIDEDLLLSDEISVSKILRLFEFEDLKYYVSLFTYTELDDSYKIEEINYTYRTFTGIALLALLLPLISYSTLYFVFSLLIIYKYIEFNSEHVLRVYRSLIIYYKFNPFGKTLFKKQLDFIFIQGMILFLFLFTSIGLLCLGFIEYDMFNIGGLLIFSLSSCRYYKFFTEFLPLFIKVKLRK